MAINLPIISEWNPKGLNRAINDFKKLETNGQKASFAIRKAAVPAGLALAALGAIAFDAVKAFAEDDAAAQKLGTTLKNVTGATEAQIKSVEDFITKTSRAAAVADDQLRPALDSLVRGTGDVTKAQNLLTLALDISAGTGKDLGSVSDALSKAFNGNFMALKKLDPALAELIKSGASTDEVFAALGKTFEGQASVAANTTQGSMKNLNIQMGELKESIGAAVMPALQALIPYLMKFATWAQENPDLVKIAGAAIVGLTASIVAMNIAMALNPLGAMVLGFGAIATGAAIVFVKFEQFRPLLLGLFGPGGMAVGAILYFKDTIIEAFDTIKDFGASIFNGIGTAFKGVINAVVAGLEGGLNFALKGLNTILDGIDVAAGPFVNFGTIPTVNLPRLAEGGIVTGPTIAMIGEAGPEAVIPLNRAGGMGMGGNTITINAGLISTPDQIGQQIIEAILKAQRRSGTVFAPA